MRAVTRVPPYLRVPCCAVVSHQKGKERKERNEKEGKEEKGNSVRLRGVLYCLHRVWVCAGNCPLSVCPVCFCAWGAAVCQCASEGARLPTLSGDTRSSRATHSLFAPPPLTSTQ